MMLMLVAVWSECHSCWSSIHELLSLNRFQVIESLFAVYRLWCGSQERLDQYQYLYLSLVYSTPQSTGAVWSEQCTMVSFGATIFTEVPFSTMDTNLWVVRVIALISNQGCWDRDRDRDGSELWLWERCDVGGTEGLRWMSWESVCVESAQCTIEARVSAWVPVSGDGDSWVLEIYWTDHCHCVSVTVPVATSQSLCLCVMSQTHSVSVWWARPVCHVIDPVTERPSQTSSAVLSVLYSLLRPAG